MLDIQTIFFNALITSVICTLVMGLLWAQNRDRFPELRDFLLSYFLYISGVLFISLRQTIQVEISILLGNTLFVLASVVLYGGIKKAVMGEKAGVGVVNYFVFTAFLLIHAYFTLVTPSLQARIINISATTIIFYLQCAWILLHKNGSSHFFKPPRRLAYIFFVYCLFAFARIVYNILLPPLNSPFKYSEFDKLLIIANEALFVLITFSIFLIFNRKLLFMMDLDLARREQAEKDVRESEERLTAVIEGSDLGYSDWLIQEGFVHRNERWAEILGYTKEEIGNEYNRWQELIHPEDIETTHQKLAEHLAGKSTYYRSEYRMRTKDGNYRWVLDQGKVIERGRDGTPLRMASTHTDITDRKSAENALRQSEARFRAYFELPLVGIAISSPQKGWIEANEYLCQMLEYTREELSKLTWDAITHPDDIEENLKYFQSAMRSEIDKYHVDKRFVCKSGKILWTSLSARIVKKPDGKVDYLIVLIQDITERKKMESALIENEALFRAIFEQAGVGVAQVNTESWKLVRVNQKYCELMGYPKEEMEKLGISDFTHPDDVKENHNLIQEMIQGKNRGFTMEKRYVCKDGNIVWGNLTVSPMWQPGEKPTTHIAVVEDITTRKLAEEKLQKQYQYLSALQETTLDLITQLDLNKLLENIVHRADALVDSDSGFLDLVDLENNQLMPYIGIGMLKDSLNYIAKPGEGVAGKTWQSGKVVLIDDYDTWDGNIKKFSPNTLGSVIGIPLISGDKVLGVLGLAYGASSKKTFTQEKIDVLLQFTRLASIAIENAHLFQSAQQELEVRKAAEAKLHETNKLLNIQLIENKKLQESLQEQAIRDPLTGLYNRHYMEESLKQEYARAGREGYPISVVVLDLDHLKDINGQYGHITGGDQALRTLSETLKNMSRAGDIVCRYGGDEFLIILYNATGQTAFQRAEQWRKALEQADIQYNDLRFNITFSAGIASYPAHGNDIEEVLLAADYALYRAKESGRNCIKLYGEK